MLQKISIHRIILKIKCVTVSTKKICSRTTVFKKDNNQKCLLSSKSAYYNDFWRSCDTEDWSNKAENTVLHHRNKLHFNICSHRTYVIWNCYNISHYYVFYCIFDQINAALVSRRYLFLRNCTNHNLFNGVVCIRITYRMQELINYKTCNIFECFCYNKCNCERC